jgi:hypothetical protein
MVQMREIEPGDIIRVPEIHCTWESATVIAIEPKSGLNSEFQYMRVTLEVSREIRKIPRRIEVDRLVTTYPGVSEVELLGTPDKS